MTKLGINTTLTEEEWEDMEALKKAINAGPQFVDPSKMEDFTAYLVRSLKERGG